MAGRAWWLRWIADRALRGLAVAMLLLTVVPVGAQQPARIVAVGDLHGDLGAWRAIARHAGVMDGEGRWAGGRTILVQLGDVPDRGDDTLAIIGDLRRLQGQARRAGGQVIALVGNHEAMNMTGDLRYVTAGEFAAFADRQSESRRFAVYRANRDAIEAAWRAGDPALNRDAIRDAWMATMPLGRLEHQAAWRADGSVGRWVAGNPAAVVVGDTLFVHGGIGPAFADWSLDRINSAVGAALAARETGPESIIHHADGPLWYRGHGQPTDAAAAHLRAVLKSHGARRMVVGHTPNPSGIVMAHDGQLIRIDTAISAAYGGTPSYLEILDSKPVAHVVPRPPATENPAP